MCVCMPVASGGGGGGSKRKEYRFECGKSWVIRFNTSVENCQEAILLLFDNK